MATAAAVATLARPEAVNPWLPAVYALTAALVLPLVILLHELGHLGTATLLGFEGGELHYSGAFVGVAPENMSLFVRRLPAAAGQIASLGAAVLAALTVRFWGPGPLALSVGLAEASRATIMFGLWGARAASSATLEPTGFDELSNLVLPFTRSGAAAFLVDLVGVLVAIGALAYVIRKVRRPRLGSLLGTCVGIAVGYAIYFGYLGPLMLP